MLISSHPSTAEEKGSDCIDKFKAMQECFQRFPDLYKDYDDDEEEERREGEEKKTASVESATKQTEIASTTTDTNNTSQQLTSVSSS